MSSPLTLTKEQIRGAASVGVRILSMESVMVPSNVAVTGEMQTLFLVLGAIASGSLVVALPAQQGEQRVNGGDVDRLRERSREVVGAGEDRDSDS